MKVRILALQGAFLEHKLILDKLWIESVYVKQREDLQNISGIILPDGKSTTIGKLLNKLEIKELIVSSALLFYLLF